jgi:hypothetical protein
MESGVRVLFEEAQDVFPPHEIQLAGLHGFDRQLVPSAGNHYVQAQDFSGFRDSHNQRFAVARSGGELGASLAQNENSPGTLSLDENHGVLRKNRSMFYFVESLERVLGEVAEKIAGMQMTVKTAFNAVQAGHAHWRSSIFRKNTLAPILASND